MKIKTCETCKNLRYDNGVFSCAVDVVPVEEFDGAWNFEDECEKWDFIYSW